LGGRWRQRGKHRSVTKRLEHPIALAAAASILVLHFSPPMTCTCGKGVRYARSNGGRISQLWSLPALPHNAAAEGLPIVNAPATIEPMTKDFVITGFTLESTAVACGYPTPRVCQ